jgi:hypothetical protein
MSFLNKIFKMPPSNQGKFYSFSVKCKRCGEIVQGQINVNNEPSLGYDEKKRPYYFCRKVLVGSQLCFQPIEVTVKFNEQRGVLERQVTGGEFVDE